MYGGFFLVYIEVIIKFETFQHNKNREQVCLKMNTQIEFKPIFSSEV